MAKETNLTESLKKLEEIVEWFENQGEADVEKGIEKVARNMLSKGIDVEIIASVTGLTPQAIRQLH